MVVMQRSLCALRSCKIACASNRDPSDVRLSFASRLLPFLTIVFMMSALAQPLRRAPDFKIRYADLHGAFVLYDLHNDVLIRYNASQCERRYSPASTFKIVNSLIGLETGVIPDEHFVIPWDSVQREVPAWNKDHNLASAIANSVVWYYQELARRVGNTRMQEFVKKVGYGNMDISGGIDRFWLGSSLLISADEELALLRRLYENRLPFSQRSMDIVKKILILEKTDSYVLRGKTGFASTPAGVAAGWFVGYVEQGGNVFFFASNIVSSNAKHDSDRIFAIRKPAAIAILKDFGLLQDTTTSVPPRGREK